MCSVKMVKRWWTLLFRINLIQFCTSSSSLQFCEFYSYNANYTHQSKIKIQTTHFKWENSLNFWLLSRTEPSRIAFTFPHGPDAGGIGTVSKILNLNHLSSSARRPKSREKAKRTSVKQIVSPWHFGETKQIETNIICTSNDEVVLFVGFVACSPKLKMIYVSRVANMNDVHI